MFQAYRTPVDAGAFAERRNAIVDALNKMVEIITAYNEDAFEKVMTEALSPVAEAARLDRVAVYRSVGSSPGLGQAYAWYKGEPSGQNGEAAVLPDHPSVNRWVETLKKGEYINGNAGDMNGEDADFCALFGIKAILFVPVFTFGKFWGVVTMEDHTDCRYFDEGCLDLMHSVARLCANAFIRAETEHKVTEVNQYNLAILNASPIGITIINSNLEFVDCNSEILNLFCTTKQHYLENFYDFSPEYQPDGSKSKEKAVEIIKMAFNNEIVVREWTHVDSHGKIIPFEVTLARVLYNNEYIILGYQYDVTNVRRMTDDIKKQSEMLAARLEQQEVLADISRGLIASGDTELLIDDALAKLGKYHGVTRVLIIGVNYADKSLRVAYQWYSNGVPPLNLIKFGTFEMVTYSFPEKLGNDFFVRPLCFADITAVPKEYGSLLDSDIRALVGAPIYVEGRLWGVLSVENRSARDWTQSQVDFISITASTMAGAIMRDIYNKKLSEALEKATVASKAKGEFLSNMSHEMRTPLNAIIGMTAIGKESADVERKNYALKKVEDASTHLLGVINDVLDMSKIEADMLKLSPIEFSFERMLQKVITVINFRVDEKSQKLKVNIDKNVPKFLVGDDQRLAQVITNLLSNAVKFTPENGEISLDASLEGEEDGVCVIRTRVTDTGIGISPEQQERLFVAFEQAENRTSRNFGGTGLGLAISKRITELMGGKIHVESELGKGAKFVFTVKMARGEKNLQSLLGPGVNRETLRVLAADDEEAVCGYLKDVFDLVGVKCDVASDGIEAYDMIDANGDYDIYFVDWRMPGMDGMELTKRIKKREGGARSVVTMISSADWALIKDEAVSAGVDKYLLKPLLSSTVIDCVNECLGMDPEHKVEVFKKNVGGTFAGKSILLVEDIDINREIVLSLLENTGLEIDCAENGAQAIDLLEKNPEKYDMVFMDVQMPKVDGLEATRRIRGDLGRRELPIVAMTANVFKHDIDECYAAGMNDYLSKPLDIDDIFNKLRKYLIFKEF
ncbi:MAG: response regulator [Oscillospiraceae bacterium]|nr:response regulator [Oscillospiraceae bacterium]